MPVMVKICVTCGKANWIERMSEHARDQEPRASAARFAVAVLFTVFVLSTPAKWATLHLASLLIVLSLACSTRSFWSAPATRLYARYSLIWLLPVVVATFAQHTLGLETATSWPEQVTLILRILGVGLGLLLLLDKQWISLCRIGIIVLACLVLHAVLGIGQWVAHPESSLTAWRAIRIDGIVGNPNPFGFFMALGVVLCASLLSKGKESRAIRISLWMAITIFVLAILGSGSRGAVIAAAAGMAVVFPPSSPRRIGVYIAILGTLAGAYFVSSWQDANAYSDGTRMAALEFSLESISYRPLTGWGFESFTRLPNHSGINSPHNMLLDLALSSGVLTLAAFLVAFALVTYPLARSPLPLARTMLALIAVAFVAGTFEYSVLSATHFRGPWVLIFALACQVVADNDRNPGAQQSCA